MTGPGSPSAARRAVLRSRRIAVFAGVYLVHFLRANYTVAGEILTPGSGLSPAIVAVALRCRTRAEIAAYMGLITLSPGTMALTLSEDRSRLTVHGMHAGDPEAFRAQLRELEHRMLAAWRPVASSDDRPSRR